MILTVLRRLPDTTIVRVDSRLTLAVLSIVFLLVVVVVDALFLTPTDDLYYSLLLRAAYGYMFF